MMIREANLKFGSMDKRSRTTAIILHHAAAVSCTVEDIHRWHLARAWAGIGYHYFVRKNGEVWRGRPENTVGAHAYNHNSYSLGVCFEGNYEGDDKLMPDAQRESGIALLRELIGRYGKLDILGHRNVNATACPGKYFPFEEIKSAALADPSEPPSPAIYKVQAGAFTVKANAEAYAAKLDAAGFPTILVQAGDLYRVQVGAFAERDNADGLIYALRGMGFDACLTVGDVPSVMDNKVLRFQQAAIEAGYSLPKYGADGKWGSETESVASRALVRQGSTGALARLVQELFIGAGYSLPTYGADGKIGDETVGQIKAFQRACGLSADGVVGHDTWAALLGV